MRVQSDWNNRLRHIFVALCCHSRIVKTFEKGRQLYFIPTTTHSNNIFQELKKVKHMSHHVDPQTGIVMVMPRVPLKHALDKWFECKGKINPLGQSFEWETQGQRIITYMFKEGVMKDRDQVACTATETTGSCQPYPEKLSTYKYRCEVPLPEFLGHGTGPMEGTCVIHCILIRARVEVWTGIGTKKQIIWSFEN